jgi:hypothetical protein
MMFVAGPWDEAGLKQTDERMIERKADAADDE